MQRLSNLTKITQVVNGLSRGLNLDYLDLEHYLISCQTHEIQEKHIIEQLMKYSIEMSDKNISGHIHK